MKRAKRSRYVLHCVLCQQTFAEDAQITRRIKRTLQKSIVDHAVAERQKWNKFGLEKGNKAGPDRATTTVGENVALKISAGNKVHLLLTSSDDISQPPDLGV